MNQGSEDPRETFARLVSALEPYMGQIALTGGWVHALYLADANRMGKVPHHWALHTDDIDITIPPVLLSDNRPLLIELAQQAGFEVVKQDWLGPGEYDLIKRSGDAIIDLDFLTRAERPDETIPIKGQGDLVAHGYPDLNILLENTTWIEAGEDIHPSLNPPVRIRVPTPAAYVLQKGLASQRRTDRKAAKDIVYIYEIIRHPSLGSSVRAGLPALAIQYPDFFRSWCGYLGSLTHGHWLVVQVVEQLLEANRAQGDSRDIAAKVVSTLRGLVRESASTAFTKT